MKRKSVQRFTIIVVLLILLGSGQNVACNIHLTRHQEPELEDRSIGWTPIVLFQDTYNLLRDAEDPFFNSFLFAGNHITADQPLFVNMKDKEDSILTDALKTAFPYEYIDNGSKDTEVFPWKVKHIALYTGGETCAIIDTTDGRIVQCIDTRIQKQFSDPDYKLLRSGLVHITVDLAELSQNEVKELSSYTHGFSDAEMPKPFADPEDCPLDVKKAFEISSNNLYELYPSGRWEYIGDGQYVIYDAQNSDNWLIYNKYFIMLLNKSTGEKSFFSLKQEGFADLSVECQD